MRAVLVHIGNTIVFLSYVAEDENTAATTSDLPVQCLCLNNGNCRHSCRAEKCFFASLASRKRIRASIYGCMEGSRVAVDLFHQIINISSPCPKHIAIAGLGDLFFTCCDSKDFCNMLLDQSVSTDSSVQVRSLQGMEDTGMYT